MRSKPTQLPQDSRNPKRTYPTPRRSTQHGPPRPDTSGTGTFSLLLDLPSESLTHVTSYLDPAALLALGRTNRLLYEHVKDDNTWHRAFICQCLGILPEGDAQDGANLMLRRSESSWRQEFTVRYTLRNRWAYSRNGSIAHVPHHSPISEMHLLGENALLCSSLQYGVVSRSLPLQGKVLKGFLDASGTGLGIGNPNAEFTPNVTACALASEGQTARIAWGFRSGEVAVTTAAKAIDPATRGPAALLRCRVEDQHHAPVLAAKWDGLAVVTGAADGQVKLWDGRRARCVWTSPPTTSLIPDPGTQVAVDLGHGIIAAAMRSGWVIVWTGFSPSLASPTRDEEPGMPHNIREYRIAPRPAPVDDILPQREHAPLTTLVIDATQDAQLSLLICHENDPVFYRVRLHLPTSDIARVSFGGGSFGAIRSLSPQIFAGPDESNIIVGYQIGCVSIFDWNTIAPPNGDTIEANKTLEAHTDGGVTALAFNGYVLLTGSERGTTNIWDGLTFAQLRSFGSPSARREEANVGQILLDREMFVASVGQRVMAWKAGPVSSKHASKWSMKGSHKNRASSGIAKWHGQYELKRDIADSRWVIDQEQSNSRATQGRDREQRSTLDTLGLNEVEAVEYVLMLSRDEEEERRTTEAITERLSEDEGVFIGDFDDVRTAPSTPMRLAEPLEATSSMSSPGDQRSRRYSGYASSRSSNGTNSPRFGPSSSNAKIQISPRFIPEPMEAGFSISPLASASTSSSAPIRRLPSLRDVADFPVMVGSSPSSSSQSDASSLGLGLGSRRAGAVAAPGVPGRSWSGGPESVRSSGSSWATPLTRAASAATPSSAPRVSQLTASIAEHEKKGKARDMDEDEELKFVLELSLAEARSRGETV